MFFLKKNMEAEACTPKYIEALTLKALLKPKLRKAKFVKL
jgi:hypothetical protein